MAVAAQSPEEAEEAIVAASAACGRIAVAEHRADPLLTAMRTADVPAAVRPAAGIGSSGRFPIAGGDPRGPTDANAEIRDAAVSRWPTGPMPR